MPRIQNYQMIRLENHFFKLLYVKGAISPFLFWPIMFPLTTSSAICQAHLGSEKGPHANQDIIMCSVKSVFQLNQFGDVELY